MLVYSTDRITINTDENIPIIAPVESDASVIPNAEAVLKLDPECTFDSDDTIVLMKYDNTMRIFQYNRFSHALDLIYTAEGDNLAILKEAFSSGVILEDKIFDEVTRIILEQLNKYRANARAAML